LRIGVSSSTACPPSAPVAIAVDQVGKSVQGPEGEVHILDNITLTVHEGTSVAIVGASGSGKTTLLGLLAGLDLPSRGRIALAGQDLGAGRGRPRPAARVRSASCSRASTCCRR
jgi:putative ABC transport system ATP-binding protein